MAARILPTTAALLVYGVGATPTLNKTLWESTWKQKTYHKPKGGGNSAVPELKKLRQLLMGAKKLNLVSLRTAVAATVAIIDGIKEFKIQVEVQLDSSQPPRRPHHPPIILGPGTV